MKGYVISRDSRDNPTQFVGLIGIVPVTRDELADAKVFADRRSAVRLLHRDGLHQVGWRVENVRRYRQVTR